MRFNHSIRKDVRLRALLLVAAIVPVSAVLIGNPPGQANKVVAESKPGLAANPFADLRPSDLAAHQRMDLVEDEEPVAPVRATETPDERAMAEARQLIKGKKFNEAITRLHAERETLQKRPDAYVLLGRALEGRGDAKTARDFYARAIDLNPMESLAYWGFATSSETLGDLESALGAMRSFLHTDPNPDPKRLRIAQARSAIWEWESQLGRGPWGPTKGIIPGLTPEQQRRQKGEGIAIMMPLPETKQPDGTMKFEVKSHKQIKLFEEEKDVSARR